MLRYELFDRGTDDVWCILHGAAWRVRTFYRRCQMQDHASCIYPVSGWFGNWGRSHAEPLAYTIVDALNKLGGAERLILAGFSDGATWTHDFAYICDADAIVHYAGLWNDTRADVPACFFLGEQDNIGKRVGWFGVEYPRKATYRAAEAYVERVHEVPGGHSWNPDANEFIRSMVLARMRWASSFESESD